MKNSTTGVPLGGGGRPEVVKITPGIIDLSIDAYTVWVEQILNYQILLKFR